MRALPSEDRWQMRWERVGLACQRIAQGGPECIRLAKIGRSDGFGSGFGGSRRSDHADPTGAAVVTLVPDPKDPPRPDSDLVAMSVEELFEAERSVRRAVERLERLVWSIEHRGDERAGRLVSGGDCLACDRYVPGTVTDRLRGGYCDSCRKAFERWRETAQDPSDHVAFRKARAEFLAEVRAKMSGLGLGNGAVT